MPSAGPSTMGVSRRAVRLYWRSLLVGLGLLLCLIGPSSARAAGSATAPPDSLTAAQVAFHLRYDASVPAAPSPPDRWFGRDKAKHVAASALWTLSTQYVLVSKAGWAEADALPVSIASGAAVGVAKEAYDASRPGRTASVRDLVANGVGIGLAVGVIVL